MDVGCRMNGLTFYYAKNVEWLLYRAALEHLITPEQFSTLKQYIQNYATQYTADEINRHYNAVSKKAVRRKLRIIDFSKSKTRRR